VIKRAATYIDNWPGHWVSSAISTAEKSVPHPATPCNTLQHPATPCNTLQHTTDDRLAIPRFLHITSKTEFSVIPAISVINRKSLPTDNREIR